MGDHGNNGRYHPPLYLKDAVAKLRDSNAAAVLIHGFTSPDPVRYLTDEGFSVAIIDPSSNMNLLDVLYSEPSRGRMPFGDRSFDAIICENVGDLPEDIHRVLRGSLILSKSKYDEFGKYD